MPMVNWSVEKMKIVEICQESCNGSKVKGINWVRFPFIFEQTEGGEVVVGVRGRRRWPGQIRPSSLLSLHCLLLALLPPVKGQETCVAAILNWISWSRFWKWKPWRRNDKGNWSRRQWLRTNYTPNNPIMSSPPAPGPGVAEQTDGHSVSIVGTRAIKQPLTSYQTAFLQISTSSFSQPIARQLTLPHPAVFIWSSVIRYCGGKVVIIWPGQTEDGRYLFLLTANK